MCGAVVDHEAGQASHGPPRDRWTQWSTVGDGGATTIVPSTDGAADMGTVTARDARQLPQERRELRPDGETCHPRTAIPSAEDAAARDALAAALLHRLHGIPVISLSYISYHTYIGNIHRHIYHIMRRQYHTYT